MNPTPAVAWDSVPGLALISLSLASLVLLVAWWRGGLGRRTRRQRVAALAALTLFLCFDLVVFGAFTRLTDSGLGCPDWPGCYATASPIAAAHPIAQAEARAPSGPVTERKAWIEMIHRYFAMALGSLIVLMLAVAVLARDWRAMAWAGLTLAWIIGQGVFGALTVTWKLYPAIVTAHLLGGMGLLALLALQAPPPLPGALRERRDRIALAAAAVALVAQLALGGWVSTNYAVLACNGLFQCNGHWWPAMNWSEGFTLLRELGRRPDGEPISQTALVAIQWAHRLFALAVVGTFAALVARLWSHGEAARGRALAIGGLVVLQVATGLGNVVLGWPMSAALAHSAGAAALVILVGREVAAVMKSR